MGGNLLCLFLELDSADFAVSAGASGAVFAVMGAMIYAVIRGRGHIEDLSARQVVIMAAFSVLPSFTSFLFLYLKNNVPLLIVADLLYFVKTFIPETERL